MRALEARLVSEYVLMNDFEENEKIKKKNKGKFPKIKGVRIGNSISFRLT